MVWGGAAGAANATITSPPGGGTWDSGASAKLVWSDYHHPSKTHRSSVVGEIYYTSDWTAPGLWSYAATYAKLSGNKAYWDVK